MVDIDELLNKLKAQREALKGAIDHALNQQKQDGKGSPSQSDSGSSFPREPRDDENKGDGKNA